MEGARCRPGLELSSCRSRYFIIDRESLAPRALDFLCDLSGDLPGDFRQRMALQPGCEEGTMIVYLEHRGRRTVGGHLL